ncbi:MAG: hypothetical protein RL653_203 [Pseudomonadota bacterium]
MRRPRLRLRLLLLLVPAAPLLLVGAFFAYARHVPWTVPGAHVPPAHWKPAAPPVQPGIWVRALGVSGYEVTDGSTTLLLDPTPTRPSPAALLSGPLAPDEALGAEWCPRADAVLVNHTHHDHALDTPSIAKRTGALVVGSQNTVNLALSRGVAAERTRVVQGGDRLTLGTFRVQVRRGRHTHIAGVPQPMSGTVAKDAGPLWFWQYALDETFAYHLESITTGATVWFHPASTWSPGELEGLTADTLIIGVTGEAMDARKAKGLLAEARPVRVLPTHFDNFFQPLGRGLALMPGLDLDAARAHFLAEDPRLEWGVLPAGEKAWLPAGRYAVQAPTK